MLPYVLCYFFFFQAEDGIRDLTVTGVQTCALPICPVNDRLGEVRTMRLGATLYALGYALLPLAPSVPMFLLIQVLLPLGTALLFPANSALVSHRADKHEFGLMMGVQQALRGVASVAGPIWAGPAYQHLGPSVPVFACAVIIALALLVAARVPRGEPGAATPPVACPSLLFGPATSTPSLPPPV